MSYTEFYCDASVGSNINAGDKTANGVVTSTNGNWNSGTGVFTAAAGTPFSGVSVGDFASVYNDGATLAVFIGRVTTVGGGGASLTVSLSAASGTAPTTSATARSCTTGGAWKGPNAAVNFPFNFITNAQKNAAGNPPRVNLKNNATYSITSAVTHANADITFQGYSSAVGDGGRFTLDSGTNAIVPFTLSQRSAVYDFIVQGSSGGASTGTNSGFVASGGRTILYRGVVNNVRGHGFDVQSNSGGIVISECEAYSCNTSNTSGLGGMHDLGAFWIRCISHSNSGGNNVGFIADSAACYMDCCIADTNGSHGFNCTTSILMTCVQCDAYNNGGSGFATGTFPAYLENCNAVKNGAYGFDLSSSVYGLLINCAVGTGTQGNTSGSTNIVASSAIQIIGNSGSVTSYASGVTPWVNPATGDFRINLAAAKNAGRGSFTQTAVSYSGAIGYPDIGAAQHLDSGGGSTAVEVVNIAVLDGPARFMGY